MDGFTRRIKELLDTAPRTMDYDKKTLIEFVRGADGFVSKWCERHAMEGLWAKIQEARQGEPDEEPTIFAVSTKDGYVYRPKERMTAENYQQVLARGNKTLVRLRDKLALSRDTVLEQFERDLLLLVVGQALDVETGDVIRVRPIHKDMLPGLFPEDDEQEDETDEE